MDIKASMKNNTDDAIEKLKGTQESFGFWTRRKRFLKAYWGMIPAKELDCLSYCYTNILTYGCSYSEQKMTLLDLLVRDMFSNTLSKSEKKVAKTVRKLWQKRIEEIEEIKENGLVKIRSNEKKVKGQEEEIVMKYETGKSNDENRNIKVQNIKRTGMDKSYINADSEVKYSVNGQVHRSLQGQDVQRQMVMLETVEKKIFQTTGIGKPESIEQLANCSLDTKSTPEARLIVQNHPKKDTSTSNAMKAQHFQNIGLQDKTNVNFGHCTSGTRTIGRGLSWLSLFNTSDLDGMQSDRALTEVKDINTCKRSQKDNTTKSPSQVKSPKNQFGTIPTTSSYVTSVRDPRSNNAKYLQQTFTSNAGTTKQVYCQSVSEAEGMKKTTPERLREVSEKIQYLQQSETVVLPSVEKKENYKVSCRLDPKSFKCYEKQRKMPKHSSEKKTEGTLHSSKIKGINSALNVLKSAKEKVKQVVAGLGNKGNRKVLEVPGRYVPKKSVCFESEELVERNESHDRENKDSYEEDRESCLEEEDLESSSHTDSESSCSWESVQSESDESLSLNQRNSTSISYVRNQIAEEIHRKHAVTGSRPVKKKTFVPTYTDLLRRYYNKGSVRKVITKDKGEKCKISAVKSAAPACEHVRNTCISTDIKTFNVEEHRRKIRNYSDLLKTQYMYKPVDWYNNNEETGYHGDSELGTLWKTRSQSNKRVSYKHKELESTYLVKGENLEVENGRSAKRSSVKYIDSVPASKEITDGQDVVRNKMKSMTFVNSTIRGRGKQSQGSKDPNNNFIPYCKI